MYVYIYKWICIMKKKMNIYVYEYVYVYIYEFFQPDRGQASAGTGKIWSRSSLKLKPQFDKPHSLNPNFWHAEPSTSNPGSWTINAQSNCGEYLRFTLGRFINSIIFFQVLIYNDWSDPGVQWFSLSQSIYQKYSPGWDLAEGGCGVEGLGCRL